jgi:hypothetical protein
MPLAAETIVGRFISKVLPFALVVLMLSGVTVDLLSFWVV